MLALNGAICIACMNRGAKAAGIGELNRKDEPQMSQSTVDYVPTPLTLAGEIPLTVKEAAKYLGVSSQTVYLWVERKQIPHLRVMGRNIRFLKSDLEPFRASFKQEMENA